MANINSTTKRNRIDIISDIMAFLNDNDLALERCVEELDSVNGWLGDDRYYEMEEVNELLCTETHEKVLRMAFYGHDVNGGAFNPNASYFYFNGYGNLVSANYKDYSDYISEDTIESLCENRDYIWAIYSDADLCRLFDELAEAEQ